MRIALVFFMAFTLTTSFAQDFNGEYTSDYTTFKDDHNPENNFHEASTFYVSVEFNENNYGFVTVQDPHIPNKVLIYEVSELVDVIEAGGNRVFSYRASAIHLQDPLDTQIVFYYNSENRFKLLVLDDQGSQGFHNLVWM